MIAASLPVALPARTRAVFSEQQRDKFGPLERSKDEPYMLQLPIIAIR